MTKLHPLTVDMKPKAYEKLHKHLRIQNAKFDKPILFTVNKRFSVILGFEKYTCILHVYTLCDSMSQFASLTYKYIIELLLVYFLDELIAKQFVNTMLIFPKARQTRRGLPAALHQTPTEQNPAE